jgi:hypothetical protein
MLELKLRYHIPLPTRANRAILPAACAFALAALSGLQFALTSGADVPLAISAGGGARANLPLISAGAVPGILMNRPIFAPARTTSAAKAGGIARPLNGAQIVGTITVQGKTYAVVQEGGGRIIRLPVGGHYAGWQLRALTSQGAVFRQGSARLPVTFGTTPVQSAGATEQAEEQEQ